jgi:hypothetical protein
MNCCTALWRTLCGDGADYQKLDESDNAVDRDSLSVAERGEAGTETAAASPSGRSRRRGAHSRRSVPWASEALGVTSQVGAGELRAHVERLSERDASMRTGFESEFAVRANRPTLPRCSFCVSLCLSVFAG